MAFSNSGNTAGDAAAKTAGGTPASMAGDAAQSAKSPRQAEHVAIIMDGNGRWATNRGWPRLVGHRKGAERVKEKIGRASCREIV